MKIKSVIISAAVLIAVLSAWIAHGNQNIGLTTYEAKVSGLPQAFEGLRIVQLSDLHNVVFKDGNAKLIALVEQAEPDMIFITGDMLDSRRTDTQAALSVADKVVGIAATYYVPGNHEARLSEYGEFERSLENLGVTVLRNSAVSVEKDGEVISIAGVDDPKFAVPYDDVIAEKAAMQEAIDSIDAKECTLLLSHRPELFEVYVEKNIAFTFSGHTHGGQIRLPMLGGLYTPDSGFLPKYDGGVYHEDNSAMIVSRGIGNSIFPFRVNNDPEVVLAILECK